MSYEAGSKECRHLIDAKENLLSAWNHSAILIQLINYKFKLKIFTTNQKKCMTTEKIESTPNFFQFITKLKITKFTSYLSYPFSANNS